MLLLSLLWACTNSPADEEAVDAVAGDSCSGDQPLATCVEPTLPEQYYIDQSSMYFDTMDYQVDLNGEWPEYSEMVARWEWPPWLKLTGYTETQIHASDTLLTLYPSIVPERDCRFFDQQPFGRCYIVFYYDAHDGRPCPVYEEFTFNEVGEITFIEAWSDLPGMLPMDKATDPWAEGPDVARLSTKVPGMGRSDGLIDLDSPEMAIAAQQDADVADFVYHARDWQGTYLDNLDASGGNLMWERGCGWETPL